MGGRGAWRAVATAAVLAAFGCADAGAQVLTRPPLLQERLNPEPQYLRDQLQLVWPRALRELGVESGAPAGDERSTACVYSTALEVLRQLRRDLGPSSAYVKAWARNQDRVFSACDNRQSGPIAPEPLSGPGLPVRATGDFDYQLASWNFYKGEYEAALPLFEKVARLRRAPQRGNAAYMGVRTLAYMKRLDAAYAAIDRILADPSLRQVHGISANYRFVIMSNSNTIPLLEPGSVSPALARRHLRWLHDTMVVDITRVADPVQAAADAKDAREQLATYFPYHDKSGSVDWWLRDGKPDSARMQAVQELAPALPLIDWMQASWADNIFDTDWLWALHDADNAYWEGSAGIVAHAWKRWEKERDGAWLQVAIMRVHPGDPLARSILAAARAYLAHPWARPQREESAEYASWVFSLWENALRLHLGLGETHEAVDLLAQGRDLVRVPGFSERLPLFHRAVDPAATVDRMLRWLVYRGDVQDARAVLSAARQQFPDSLRQWRSLLATDIVEAHAAGEALVRYSYGSSAGNDATGWERLLDDLSSDALYQMASGTAVQQRYRALFARTALARALILGYDNATVDRYAALAGQLNPSIREQVLAGVARHARSDYISLLLRIPRLRPAVMADYAPIPETGGTGREQLSPEAIDVNNHNDNNWWCAFDQGELRERAFKAWRIVPTRGRLLGGEGVSPEVSPYLARQRVLLAAHPYRALVDDTEIKALEGVPSGPEFLSRAVIAREDAATGELAADDRNARAADLHRAVRTTRYGCDRDGSHADYSRAAFKLLHGRYDDTPWAKATPYWFK